MNTQPLVSIITPVYNGARFLEETIRSVLSQDYPSVEHIVIDDGSTDGGATIEVLQRYPHVRWWSHPNQGQYATMNAGLAAARGDFVLFLSADDLLAPPGAIGRAMTHLTRHTECNAVYGRWLGIDEHSRLLPVQSQIIGRYPKSWFSYVPFISHCSLFVRRAVLTEDLLFDPTLRYTGDADWIQRLLRAGIRPCYVDTVLARYRFHSSQATQSARAAIGAEQGTYLQKYNASPRLYRLINDVLDWRSRTLLALYTLQSAGPRELLRRTRAWQHRRQSSCSRR